MWPASSAAWTPRGKVSSRRRASRPPLIDLKAVKKALLTVLLDAVNAYLNALQDSDVMVEPPRERLQAEALKGNTTKTFWKLKKKL